MPIQCFRMSEDPIDIAVSKAEQPDGGCFYLDFSRPLGRYRWLGFLNKWVGITQCLSVPIIHEGAAKGDFEISVLRNDPWFDGIKALWKDNYPTSRKPPEVVADGMQIILDFAHHFPDGS